MQQLGHLRLDAGAVRNVDVLVHRPLRQYQSVHLLRHRLVLLQGVKPVKRYDMIHLQHISVEYMESKRNLKKILRNCFSNQYTALQVCAI